MNKIRKNDEVIVLTGKDKGKRGQVQAVDGRGMPLGNSGAAITADYGLVLADAGKTIYHTSGSAHNVTIPANASIAFPIGTVIRIDNTGNAGAAGGASLGAVVMYCVHF